MKLLLTTYLLYSQSNGYPIYDYLNSFLFLGVIIFGMIYLPKYRAKLNRFNFTSEFLRLTAYMLKSDRKVTEKELDFVYKFFTQEFGKASLPLYKKQLSVFIKSNGSIKKALKKIDFEQDPATKLQLLNFLIKITIVDGFLTKNELNSLKIITHGIGLRIHQLESILAMYSFITETEFNNKNQKTKYKRNSHSKIDESYKILELSKGATSVEVKKAYRKLVILYHPDKAMHLEKEYQKSAKEMYQKVTDAYEILKASLDFK
jgi:DnaJ like chaperone protein